MLRKNLLICFIISGFFSATVDAGWHEFWDRVHLDFHRNNVWPEPFSTMDRRAVEKPFNAMVASGWKAQNTLGDAYFDKTTNQLTDGGRRRVFWIVKNVPVEHRTIFIAESFNPKALDVRIDSVQQEVARALPNQQLPSVVPTHQDTRGWSATSIYTLMRKESETRPSPRLPGFQKAGT